MSAVRHRGKSLELSTAEGTLTTQFLVVADGAVGTTARAAGWVTTLDTVPAVEWEIRVPDDTLARFADIARFDIGAVDPGYGWVFPKEDHLSVGVISMKRGARELKAALERYLAGVGITDILERDCYGGLVPVRPQPTLTRGRALLVGDAAGLVDPITAEGISNSLISGRLAGEAIAASDFDPWKVQGGYEQAIEHEILSELRLARTLSRSLYNMPRGRTWFMQRFGQQFAEAMTDLFLGERTYRDTLLKPSNWYKLVRQYLKERRAARA
jgi:flavin-dependent dehydrogenase